MKNTLKITAAIILIGTTSSISAGMFDFLGGHDDHKEEKKNVHGHSDGGHGDDHDMSKMDAHWASPAAEANKPNPIASSASSIAKGSAIYQKNCASCHGKKALGDGPAGAYLKPKPTNLKVMAGGHKDGDFAWKIANGRGPMPAWKGILSESDIWNTVNYIQSLKTSSMKKGMDHHGKGHGGGSDHH